MNWPSGCRLPKTKKRCRKPANSWSRRARTFVNLPKLWKKKDASAALTAGKRAEREFEELRDEFRKQAAGEFNDSVREMRSDAQQLDEQQEQLAEDLEKMGERSSSPGLRKDDSRAKRSKTHLISSKRS